MDLFEMGTCKKSTSLSISGVRSNIITSVKTAVPKVIGRMLNEPLTLRNDEIFKSAKGGAYFQGRFHIHGDCRALQYSIY